jgi:hypothetical protein
MKNPAFVPHKLVTATLFSTSTAAAKLANHIAADDPHWRYEVNRVGVARFVISVHEVDANDNHLFLGYL